MNRKGFTLIELIATLVILGVVLSITIVGANNIFGSAKNKTEDVFVGTIRDAMDMYLTSNNVKELDFEKCNNTLKKSYNANVLVYKATSYITFKSVIDSEYKPITQKDLVNPANDEKICRDASLIPINIYRDADYVYYYSVDKSGFDCLLDDGVISNLPEGFVC